MPFWWEWQLALYILSDFPGIKNLNGRNDLSGLNDLYSLISSKIFTLKKNIYFWWVVIFYYLKKAPKSQNNSKFIKEQEIWTNWTIDGAQHQKNKNWWIWHWTCRIQNISKNHNLYLHQSKITLPGLLWDTLYVKIYSASFSFNLVFISMNNYKWH